MTLLPPNASKELRVFEDTLEQSLVKLQKIDLNLNPLTCKEEFLPHLAFLYSLDISNLIIEEQRQYIHNAFEIRRYAGTMHSVRAILKVIFDEAQIIEWFNYGGEPFNFQVNINLKSDLTKRYGQQKFNTTNNLLNTAKNVRSVFDGFLLKLPSTGNIQIAGGGVSNTKITNNLVIDYKAKGSLEIAGGGISNTKLTNDLVIEYKAKGNLEIAGGGISNTKLTNDLVIEYPLLDIKNYGGGVMDVSLSNEFKATPLLEEIHIKGAGVWII